MPLCKSQDKAKPRSNVGGKEWPQIEERMGKKISTSTSQVYSTLGGRESWTIPTRRGGNRASVFSVLKKDVIFARAKLLIHFTKMVEFSRENQVYFSWCLLIYKEFSLENSRDFFLLSHRHALLQRATGLLTPLPDPDASHQLWIHLAIKSLTPYVHVWRPSLDTEATSCCRNFCG